jgi:hypothetical protein
MKFAINDTVRIISRGSRYFDQVGTITAVNEGFNVSGLDPRAMWFGANELVLAERPEVGGMSIPNEALIEEIARLIWEEGHYSTPWEEWPNKDRWLKAARRILDVSAEANRPPRNVTDCQTLKAPKHNGGITFSMPTRVLEITRKEQ